MKQRVISLLAMVMLSPLVFADTIEMQSTAILQPSCFVSVENLNFGIIDNNNDNESNKASGTITATCTKG